MQLQWNASSRGP